MPALLSFGGLLLDLLGFCLLAFALWQEQRRLTLLELRSKLREPTSFIVAQYLGPDELTANLADQHLTTIEQADSHALEAFEKSRAQLFEKLKEIEFPRFLPKLRNLSVRLSKVDDLNDDSALDLFRTFLVSFKEIEKSEDHYARPSRRIFLAILLVILGFVLQLFGAALLLWSS